MPDIPTLTAVEDAPPAASIAAEPHGPEAIITAKGRVRVPLRLHPDTKARAKYWADRANLSVNEYMVEAVEEKIRRENGDYDLPTLEIARLAQLVDQMQALTSNMGNLEAVTLQGFESLMGLTRGDNYLLGDEDGELGAVGV